MTMASSGRAPARPRLFYGWIVVVVAAVVVLITAGVRSAPGAFLIHMTENGDWSTSSVSFATAAGLVVFGIAGPLSGWLIARAGLRLLITSSLLITAAAMFVTSRVVEIWQLALVFGVITGAGTGLVASVLGPTIAARWFVRNRGLVVGIFGASTSAGQLIFVPVLTWLALTFDWRAAAAVMGVLALTLVPAAIAFVRSHPADVGLRALGAPDGLAGQPRRPDPGIVRQAFRTADFWFLAGTFMVCGATANGLIGQHFIPHAVEHGFTAQSASIAVAVMGVFNFVGTIASGWLTDRYDARKLLLTYYAFRGVSLLFVPFIHDTLSIGAFAVLFGLDYIASVPPTVALIAQRFGAHNVSVIYGWIFMAHMFGAAAAAWVTGLVRETAGDYAPAFVVAGWIAILAGMAALAIRNQPPTPAPAAAIV